MAHLLASGDFRDVARWEDGEAAWLRWWIAGRDACLFPEEVARAFTYVGPLYLHPTPTARGEEREREQERRDLAMIVGILARRLAMAMPDSSWPGRARDYLRRKGLEGNVLREDGATLPPPDLDARIAEAERRGIEAAIKVIEGGSFLDPDAPPARFARDVVRAIRRDGPDMVRTLARAASGPQGEGA